MNLILYVIYYSSIIFNFVWILLTIYFGFIIFRLKKDANKTNEYSKKPPNNEYSYYIRYLYSKKIDSATFISTIFELILKNSISLRRYNKSEYFFINNKVDENLNKSEIEIKNILFKKLGDGEKVSINSIRNSSKKNSGYFYAIYKEWQDTLKCEVLKKKYFKRVKPLIDKTIFYFSFSFVTVFLDFIFLKINVAALIIFTITSTLIVKVNNYLKIDDELKNQYIEWIKFKNYIKSCNNDLIDLDTITLEKYCLYAYIFDEKENFKKIINKKYYKDKESIENSVLLSIVNLGIFDNIEKEIRKSIKIAKINYTYFFARNKGRG